MVLVALLLAHLPSVAAQELPLQPLIDRDLLGGIEDKAPVRNSEENYYEHRAYHYLLLQAKHTPVDRLSKAARRDLTFAHLFEESSKYRGEVVHLQGRLRRLRQFDATPMAAKDGIPTLYEGWVFTDTSNSNPYCVVVSELSAGLQPGEKLDRTIDVDAFYFKRYRYKAGDGWRDAPLLIGKQIRASAMEAESSSIGSAFSSWLLPLLFFVALACTAACFVLNWFYRRSDRAVHQMLQANRMHPIPEANSLASDQPSSPTLPDHSAEPGWPFH